MITPRDAEMPEDEPPEHPEPHGGNGGSTLFANPRHVQSDLLLGVQALQNGYPVTPDLRRRIVDRAVEHMEDENARISQGGIKALIAVDGLNVRRESIAQDDRHHDAEMDLSADAARVELLGIFAALRDRSGDAADQAPPHAGN